MPFLSVLFISTAQIRLCVGGTHVHTELSQHGRIPGARLRNQQITPSPQPHYSPSETCVYKLRHDKSLETSFAAGSSTPMHFLFPVKNPFPGPTQNRRSVISTPPAHGCCIFRKILSPLKFFTRGPFPSSTPCLFPSTQQFTLRPVLQLHTPGGCVL